MVPDAGDSAGAGFDAQAMWEPVDMGRLLNGQPLFNHTCGRGYGTLFGLGQKYSAVRRTGESGSQAGGVAGRVELAGNDRFIRITCAYRRWSSLGVSFSIVDNRA